MKIKTTFLFIFSFLFLFGNLMVKAQPTEVWSQAHSWNTDRYYRGIDYHPLNNHLYVGGTEGTYVGNTDGTVVEDNMIRILDASTGELIKTISPASAMGGDWGYGIRDVEVDDAGGIYATIGTSNQYNPVQLYYWENEDADPVLLWKDASGTADDFGGSFSVYGDLNTEALIIIPFVNVAKVYYFEAINGVLGNVNTLSLSGLTTIQTPTVQALGTKISDGFWYNNVALAGPVKFNGSGQITATVPSAVFTTAGTGDTKYFKAGNKEYLVVSNLGKVQLIDITGKAADLSDVTASDALEIPGTVPTLQTVWPHVYGNGQEQYALGLPDGSYVIYSLSGGNYIKSVATDGAPFVTSVNLSGYAMPDSSLTIEYLFVDINADAKGTSEIKWYLSDNSSGLNKAEITSNAGSHSYKVTTADVGKFISFTILPVALTGTTSSSLHLFESELYGPIAPAGSKAPEAQNVSITGPIAVNETLTGNYTYYDENGDLEGNSIIKWLTADDATGTNAVEVATATLSYKVLPADAGKYIHFNVTPVAQTGALLTGETVNVVSDSAVFFPAFVPVATELTLSGRQEVAGILSGTYKYNDLNGDPEGATILKWYRADDATGTNKTEIASGSASYTAVAADEGKFILFEVTPVTTEGETGIPAFIATGQIAPKPAPEAPVASNVTVHGTPEVGGVIYGTYTYTDRTDDPEGVSIFKWFHATDAAGANKTEITAAAGKYTLIVSEEMIGKYLIFEVTPVATVGELLTGTPVSAVTSVASTASTNDGDFERMWIRAKKLQGVPEYMGTGSTERGFAVGDEHLYIASRNGGTKLLVIDKKDGSLVRQMNTEGMDVGLFRISDVEVSDDGQILACPLQTNASTAPFVIYKWENELAAPVKWIEYTATEAMRLGDKFTVIGDVSSNAVIYAAASANNKVIRWVVTGGIVDAGTVITLQNTTSIGSTAAAGPFDSTPNSDFIIDGRGFQAQIFDKDGNYKSALEGIGQSNNQSNSPNVFYYKGRTLVAFYQKNNEGTWNAIIQDVTSQPHITVGTSEVFSTANQELGGVHVEVDEEYFHIYMLAANEGFGYFRGMLELPEFEYAETNEAGTEVYVRFSKNMPDSVGYTTGWTITAAGNAIAIDTIFGTGTDANLLTFKLESAILTQQAVTIAYDGTGSVVAFDGMPLNGFDAKAVINIVGAESPVASNVVITGEARVGQALTASYTYSDANGDLESGSKYQWWYASKADGSDKLKLLGENTTSYTVTTDVAGKYVAFEVIPHTTTGGENYLVGEPAVSEFMFIIGVGMEESFAAKLRVYPNPVSDQLTIDNCSEVHNLLLVDLSGKVLVSKKNHGQDIIILDMNNFEKGIYILKLTGEKGESRIESIVKTK